jgi:hypothetical protein
MLRISHLVACGLAASALAGRCDSLAAQESSSSAGFTLLKSLVGHWKGSFGGTEISLSYTLTADGSALMEESQPKSEPVMITMFTVDGDHLLATHYCSARNQPHLTTEAITGLQTRQLTFNLERVTGMRTPDDWHNTRLVMILEDKNHLTQEWTYQFKGQSGKNVFHFAREQ